MNNLFVTNGINAEIARNKDFAKEIAEIIRRYNAKDWGELCDEDIQMNKEAFRYGGRIFAAYRTSVKKVYVITDGYNTKYESTVILFAEEY